MPKVFDKWGSWVGFIIAVITLIGISFSVYFFFNSQYAKVEDVQKVDTQVQQVGKRLEVKIVNDQVDAVQQRIWNLEDRHGGMTSETTLKEANQTVNEEYRELKKKKEDLKLQLEKL